ncbi:MAG: hypothetical protein ABI266_07565 [Ginsengibacter sp.]
MKTKSTKFIRFLMGFAGILIVLTISSCSNKMSFQTSSLVPAARGYAKVKKDNNNNYHISISVTNLAEPKRLSPPKDTYVVWVETEDGVKNVGRMNSSTGFLSKKLKATLEASTLNKPKRIFITAENDGNISFPGSELILSTN